MKLLEDKRALIQRQHGLATALPDAEYLRQLNDLEANIDALRHSADLRWTDENEDGSTGV